MDEVDYRAKARELRERARTAHDPEVRAHLLTMADEYDWLAARDEDRPGSQYPSRPI